MENNENFSLLQTPKFSISLKDGNNVIEYGESLMIIKEMKKIEEGVVFCGTIFSTHLKRNLYEFHEFNIGSIFGNEYVIDTSSPEQEKNSSFFCSFSDILLRLKKVMKLPICREPLDCVFVEILHTGGKHA